MFPFPSNFSTFYTSQFSPLSFSVYAPASLWPLSNPIVYIHLLSGFFRQLNFCKIHWPKNTNLLFMLTAREPIPHAGKSISVLLLFNNKMTCKVKMIDMNSIYLWDLFLVNFNNLSTMIQFDHTCGFIGIFIFLLYQTAWWKSFGVVQPNFFSI